MMKFGKKLTGLLIAMLMTLALVPTAAAAEIAETCRVTFLRYGSGFAAMAAEGTTVTPTYDGYQLLTLTVSTKCGKDDDTSHTHNKDCYNYAYDFNPTYKSALLEVAGSEIDQTKTGDELRDAFLKYLSGLLGDNLNDFAKAVYKKITAGSIDATMSNMTSETTSVAQGYWLFVDKTAYSGEDTSYSLLLLDTNGNSEAIVSPKQSVPKVDKKVSNTESNYGDASVTANIGDTVYFQITGTVSSLVREYDQYAYIFHDTLSSGLTYNNDAKVMIDTQNVTNGTTGVTGGFAVTTSGLSDGCNLHVGCDDLFGLKVNSESVPITKDTTVVLTYSATLNENAVVAGNGNSNTVKLEYTNNPYGTQTGFTTPDEVKVFTYRFQLVKTTSDNTVLNGAEFKLYDAETGGNEIVLVATSDGYRVATTEEKNDTDFTAATIQAGNVYISGLANGTYYLEETKAPEGYNVVSGRAAVEIKDGNNDASVNAGTWVSGGLQVINKTGTELPSTGGMGTTVFYVLGSVMVLAAGVLLVTRKRMSGR